jgi:hypothetical protein
MRKMIALFALSIVVSGCGERDGQSRLEPLARGLSDAMQPAYADFHLEIRALDKGDRVTLHCVLRNVSIAATAIDVDASTLPWRNADMFEIDAVAADKGRTSKSVARRTGSHFGAAVPTDHRLRQVNRRGNKPWRDADQWSSSKRRPATTVVNFNSGF